MLYLCYIYIIFLSILHSYYVYILAVLFILCLYYMYIISYIYRMIYIHTRFLPCTHHTCTRPAIGTQPHTFLGLTSLAKKTIRTHWTTLLSARGHAQRTCRLLVVESVTSGNLQNQPLFLGMGWNISKLLIDFLCRAIPFQTASWHPESCVRENVCWNQTDVCFASHTSHFCLYGCWTKNMGNPPNYPYFNRVWNHYKPSILGYSYFWKHPYVEIDILAHHCPIPWVPWVSIPVIADFAELHKTHIENVELVTPVTLESHHEICVFQDSIYNAGFGFLTQVAEGYKKVTCFFEIMSSDVTLINTSSLPETNIFALENGWWEDDRLLLGVGLSSGSMLVLGGQWVTFDRKKFRLSLVWST